MLVFAQKSVINGIAGYVVINEIIKRCIVNNSFVQCFCTNNRKDSILTVISKRKFTAILFVLVFAFSSFCSTAFAEETKDRYVLVSGQSIGIAIMSKGLIVTKAAEVTTADGKRHYPAAEAGIRPGDIITHISGEEIISAEFFSQKVNESKGKTLKLKYSRNDKTKDVNVTPLMDSENGEYKLGIMVRDGTSGLGTITFVDENKGVYGALGHSVTDISTGIIIPILNGKISRANIDSVVKSKIGTPGELCGSFNVMRFWGNVVKNNEYGIYGHYFDKASMRDMTRVGVCSRDDIKIGKAQILCTLDDNVPQYYDVAIIKINSQSSKDVKGLVIEITDERLIEKTGGIVQGMSGSPIIQDGNVVGAVTHVCVNL